MEGLEAVAREVESAERHLSRRGFLFSLAFAAVALPRLTLDRKDKEFINRVAATLIPAEALRQTGIDVLANVEHMLAQGSADHRRKVLRLLAWSRRVAFLYGGDRVALGARGSRFEVMQKMGKALSSLCLVAFWGDERALSLIDSHGGRA
ncbi:MAG TPA: hypothetical protein VD968_08655 [Pyrinomonadaceae bacterium]|nr:hypothetical protein [Pyrinomonadaceae bacterium]